MRRGALISVLLIYGCSPAAPPTEPSGNQPVATGPLATSLIVSNPRIPPSASQTSAQAAIAYISLAPGTLSDSARVSIVNLRSSISVEPVIIAGGFDPIGIPAIPGDVLDVAVTEGSGSVTHTRIEALTLRPPRVVRTSPPKGQTDVPLNSIITIVFSEPIDPTTVTPLTVRLQTEGATIDGALHFYDSEHLTATFEPAAPLPSHTNLQLLITQAVHDLDGEQLETPVTVAFSTATDEGQTPSLSGVAALVGDWDAVSWTFTDVNCSGGRCFDDPVVGGRADNGDWNGDHIRLSFTPISDSIVHWRWDDTGFYGGSTRSETMEGSAKVTAATFQGITESSPWMDQISPCIYGFLCPLQNRQDFRRTGDMLTIDRHVDLLYLDGISPAWRAHEKLTLRTRTQGP